MSDIVRPSEPIERIASGVPGLDAILNGGFLRNGTYILMGPPGAGKTILGNQICFHEVASGGRAVYVTLLAESHSRMISHLRSLKFFDPAPIAETLTYVSGYRVLEEHGLDSLLDLIRELIRKHRATILVLDGLVSAEEFAPSELAFKKFIHELNTLVPFVGCTTFLLTNGKTKAACPEHTMVDGLVELGDPLVGLRATRELVVRKFRGSNHLRGKHVFEITNDGITVYPRLEALLANRQAIPAEKRTMHSFAVPEFDAMLGGGVPSGSTTMLLGPSGSGKTTLGLQFLAAGARQDENGLYFGFFESPPRLVAKGDAVGLGLSDLVRAERVRIEWQPPLEFIIDAIADRLLTLVREQRVRRLFIDGLGGFYTIATHKKRLSRFFAALSNELRALDITTLYTQETRVLFGPGISVPVHGLSAISENIMFLRQVEYCSELRRVISIIKTRESAHQSEIREFRITDRGIEVRSTLGSSVEAILTGIVRSRSQARNEAGALRPRTDGIGRKDRSRRRK
jgi:circadian clock protein KaiC